MIARLLAPIVGMCLLSGCVFTDLATKAGTLSGLSGVVTPSEESVMRSAGYAPERVVRYKDTVSDPADISLSIGWGKVLTGDAAVEAIVSGPAPVVAPPADDANYSDDASHSGDESFEDLIDQLADAADVVLAKKKKK